MSTLSSDNQSAEKERDPRRRRRTRRKGHEKTSENVGEARVQTKIVPENHARDDDARMNKDGSGQMRRIPCVDSNAGLSGDEPLPRQKRNTRRPGRKPPVEAVKPDLKSEPVISKPNHAHTAPQKRHNVSKASLYAALDLGTNNCRLLIATPQKRGRFRVVDGFSRIVRLGEGLTQTGNLSDAAMDRAVDALMVCAKKLKNRGINQQRLIATEACRQAGNGDKFLSRVTKETGLELEVVSRETEAQLAAQGCGSLIDRKAKGAVLFDIGGGSSELILVDCKDGRLSNISKRIMAWTSLPMGVVTLAEQFGGRDVTRELFEQMENEVLKHIHKFEGRDALADALSRQEVHLLGTSGTVTTLAGIHLNLPKYDRRKVDGLWLNNEQMDNVVDQLIDMPYEERTKNPCIGEERADLVLAGCAILNAIRKTWPTNRLRVADRGLREGLLSQMMSDDVKWKPRRSGKYNKRKKSGNSQRHGNKKS